jgi:hypothetical protein
MKRSLFILFLLLLSISAIELSAQCAMCAATAESSRAAGDSAADGLNKGVLYLFLTPYLIAAAIGYTWWRAKKKVKESESAQAADLKV